MLGKIFLALLIGVVVLGCIGLWLRKREKQNGTEEQDGRIAENVADLNDRFNRARYQDQDGK